jgi:L-amino acid N-acyltransferase YncA
MSLLIRDSLPEQGCGFRHAGLLPAIGWKHGRWLDSVLMVRPLGQGADEPPDQGLH